MVDISTPVKGFHKKVPDMAHKWDFEPDTFQKQAILRLEAHDSVFVAAHTSAGKTAVAEYAIALAHQHRTRTIYTSPIKALSNQKFRDFKKTLSVDHPGLDIGLLTGDVQIKPEASCLIMTTEILRSMLYNGSDVIRDVEWVIFDEVHYINDAERGVVWEEVLIMLPDHVSIILLSATVPNTLEFADWIGRTKRKKIYVISTAKRPVPLEHFLYTGNSNKTSNELFLLVDQHSKFLTRGYQAAIDAKKERASKGKDAYGAKGARTNYNPKADRSVWLSLITMLEKKDKLPVVAFTFSRRKCEENADQLSNLNLTTSVERSRIHVEMQKYLARLKGSDKTLPQVTRMQELLQRGIGVHHSGILPILKEMIEILFQEGLVKLLYATETFAMGVNMPARTVVFDSTRKNDGSSFRDLLPGEYVQMAGRAGRRGKDTTGTVIILCKGDVPEASDLHKMMLGKPTTLVSQFRLTYSMILNLLRVEQLRVEDMMKRSFSEFHLQRDATERRQKAEQLEKELADVRDVECVLCGEDLKSYYQACSELSDLTHRVKAAALSSPHGQKALLPGRIVVLDTVEHKNALAVILQVLVLCEEEASDSEKPQEIVSTQSSAASLQPYLARSLFRPEGRSAHRVVQVLGSEISEITVRQMKIDGDAISQDFRKRMQPRFRNDPPCRSAIAAEQELLRLTEANPEGIETMDPVKDFNIRDLDMVDAITRQRSLQEIMRTFTCINCPNFYEHFSQVRDEMVLRQNLDHLKFLLSDQSLQLLPEYHQRIEVLRKLRYIDRTNRVELKGRVACEMSNHELMITELVFHSAFTGLQHTEIVALLSCFVFQQRNCSEPKLTSVLEEGKERILSIAEAIANCQLECGLNTPADDYKGQFYFGLVEAVYEWARGMPFAEITTLTDVQEGVIVRCIQRLYSPLIIGDPTLYQKMEKASTAVKRDIVFATSLYTQ
ncbi:predicted protein [Nematostella vectensis]|uniref:Uncharacterized protein n=1 Tax=Nematostella vectensis TaxID=45351 RepID=A7SDN7_NEMVE|nr:predicted protein [Nematostella vectensis]|eukprot:XP_001630259.1 predicted protein [Nematostella vectensis]